MKYFEILWPLLTSPALRVWLRRKKKKCHKKRGCTRHIPENIGRKLPPIVYKRY